MAGINLDATSIKDEVQDPQSSYDEDVVAYITSLPDDVIDDEVLDTVTDFWWECFDAARRDVINNLIRKKELRKQ